MYNLNKRGFTLIELIIVIAVIGILAAAIFVAVDPAKRIGEANNAQRWADVTAIADAIATYTADNSGTMPTAVSSLTTNQVTLLLVKGGTPTTGEGVCANAVTAAKADITGQIVATYLPTMATDPTLSATTSAGYFIKYTSATGRFKVGSCSTYNSASIYVQR